MLPVAPLTYSAYSLNVSSTLGILWLLARSFPAVPKLCIVAFHHFLASCVTPFLLLFQTSEPLVHVLYQKANELVGQCLLLFMKPEVVAEKEKQDTT